MIESAADQTGALRTATIPGSPAVASASSLPAKARQAPDDRDLAAHSAAQLHPRPPLAALKNALTRLLRRFLARRGYAISRTEGGMADDLATYVTSALRRGIRIERICLFDSDPEPLRTFLGLFNEKIVTSLSGPNLSDCGSQFPRDQRLLLELEASALSLLESASLAPFLSQASIVIIRSKLVHFWSGECDALEIADRMRAAGFRWYDIIQRPVIGLSRPAAENVFLTFERDGSQPEGNRAAGQMRSRRVAEALNHLSAPIAAGRKLLRLAGRGSFGMPAGLCNPGAIQTPQGLVLLARGERIPWPIQQRSWTGFVASCQPMLLKLRDDLQIAAAAEVPFHAAAESNPARSEDFRLFTHQGQIYANHSTIVADQQRSARQPVVPESLRTQVGISRFDPEVPRLSYLGSPKLDRPVARIEKNWAMFSSGGRVHLIYSFNPYRVLSAEAFPELRFKSTIDLELSLPLANDGLPLRNSINPVPYDSAHLLHLVHKVYPNKQYVYWAVLIDRATLRPSKLASRPLLRGVASAGSSILYACSAVVRDGQVIVFGGIDDCSVGAWSVSQAELDRHWRPIA